MVADLSLEEPLNVIQPQAGSALEAPPDQEVELMSLPFEALEKHLLHVGVPVGHAKRVFRGLHRTSTPLPEVPSLGRYAKMLAPYHSPPLLTLERSVLASDGTRKLLFRLMGGGVIESVLLPMRRERFTLCVSTQVGCAMGCAFCATGAMKLTRSLTAGEIVAQVYAARDLVESDSDEPRELTHLVFMGMGEPLHCYENTRDAVRILLDQRGASFASSKITVSTVGLVPAMRRFLDDFKGRVPLALSLHAGTDATRNRIIPSSRKWRLSDLKSALLTHPLPRKRVLMLEYVVLPGVNDTDAELDGVANFCEGLRAIVNLIPFNPFPSAPFRSPTLDEVLSVDQRLKARGVPCSVRVTRGQERAGACGQLALRGFNEVEEVESASSERAGAELKVIN